jgi:hypothetical protein
MLEGIGRFDHAEHGFCIVPVCQGLIHNKEFYAFVAVEPQNYPYFKKYYRIGVSSSFDIYGHELLRGWGRVPPPDIVEFVRRKYNLDFGVTPPLVARMIATTEIYNGFPFPLKPVSATGA